MLARLRSHMDPARKRTPKPRRATKESHGNACPKAVARKHSLECVRGNRYSTAFTACGSWLNEKKVPLRKVIGKITRVLKVVISWCDFAHMPISTPRKEKTKQDITRTNMKRGVTISVGVMIMPTTSMATVLIRPRTTPIKVFPMANEKRLIGDIKYSSKHL